MPPGKVEILGRYNLSTGSSEGAFQGSFPMLIEVAVLRFPFTLDANSGVIPSIGGRLRPFTQVTFLSCSQLGTTGQASLHLNLFPPLI